MSLKLLALPFFVICSLVIAIGYIKPEIVLLFEKQRHLKRLQEQSASLDTLSANIKLMQEQIATANSDAGSQMTDAEFLRQIYFPATSDIEKGIDQLNFLADQSGIVVSDIQVEDAKKISLVAVSPEEEALQTSADLLIAQSDGTQMEEVPSVIHRTYVPDVFTVTIKTTGSYDAIKDFYARVVQSKRFSFPETVELTLEESEAAVDSEEGKNENSSNALSSTMAVQFLLLPKVSIKSAVGDDVFEKSKLDFETLAMIRQNQQGVTPELPAANPLGKTNLFVK
ncbi:MAG: hypothetical protein KA054_01185 [Candidatus Moranbacteria bacterium]|nr:hypothetical protein [Candidatus Moranbacteria bacterium]